jgi:hypothetical protein
VEYGRLPRWRWRGLLPRPGAFHAAKLSVPAVAVVLFHQATCSLQLRLQTQARRTSTCRITKTTCATESMVRWAVFLSCGVAQPRPLTMYVTETCVARLLWSLVAARELLLSRESLLVHLAE